MSPALEISSDPKRLDVDFIHAALTTTYWAEGRTRETVVTTIEHSLCFGAYQSGQQVGFARVVSDRAIFAYLMDVYVAPEVRGQGIGKTLVAAVTTHPELQSVKLFLLNTRDADGLYARFGFAHDGVPTGLMARRA